MSKTYLIVGANRGIGFALVKELSTNARNTVFATTRSLQSKASTELNELEANHDNLHVLPAEVTDVATLHAAAASMKDLGVTHVNAVIVSAGILADAQDLLTVTKENFLHGIEVNTLGPILVYQAFHSLLGSSTEKAIFAIITSEAGMTGRPLPFPNITYTTSKAAVNHVAAQINLNAESAIAIAIHPGMVETDLARVGAEALGVSVRSLAETTKIEALSPAQSAAAILKLLHATDGEKYAGKFVRYDGDILPL